MFRQVCPAGTNAVVSICSKWTLEWKGFCDLAQDLEEERLNYMRISLWDYANGASFICVTDDEVRLSCTISTLF